MVIAYTNTNWARSIDGSSTSGATFYLGNCLVYWLNKKQYSMSLSTTETCCAQVVWMKQTLKYIREAFDEPNPILCDNTSAINISKNPVMQSKTKHIPIKYHFLREQVNENNFKLDYVETKEHMQIYSQSLFQGIPLRISNKN